MILKELKHCILVILVTTAAFAHIAMDETVAPMSVEEREGLKEEARDMFYHAYRAYMENAYPADELMPLSCKGRWKDPLNSRGDLDDTLGNFSLTLIDTLDTLAILGDLEEFEYAVKLVIKDVSFDQDVVVSVFETNIRVLGGLLSAHILAEYFQQRTGIMQWYRAELLSMAKDLGYRLLPAFNTTTGIPHSRINLRHGLKNMRLSAHQETCTACAGTMILEMAALSRLTGDPIFEQKAHRAMDELWRMRHRSSDLMGTVLNVQSGDWIRRDSGVGAGIDSYYEYCLKAYILLGDEKYLGRFNRHYNAIMKYISQGPMLVDVHMHRPHTNSKNFMDALLAFWPGLQVLKGDIKPAVETHEMLYQVMQRHNLIPEAFTTDFHVHWGQHPLRPEFVESTYFLYKATNDPYYLEVGKAALKSLQKHARVPCGYATIKDVRTGGHDDRMDSFVLAETFKYLYLLFADPSELLLDLDEFLFTTEAHLLPLTLSRNHNLSVITISDHQMDDVDDLNSEFARCCPNTLNFFPETVRKPLKNLVDGVCPRTMRRKLLASQFTAGNVEHLVLLKNMGITVLSMSDGRVQLLHTVSSARSNADANEGLLFMQEMLELSQAQKQMSERAPLSVYFESNCQTISISAGPAHFGKDLKNGMKVTGKVAAAKPLRACDPLVNTDQLKDRIVIIERGDCMFINKVRKAEEAGAVAAIVVDNTPGTSWQTTSIFGMSGDGKNDVTIPSVFLFYQDALVLMKAILKNPGMEITIADTSTIESGKATEEGAEAAGDATTGRDANTVQDVAVKKDAAEVVKLEAGDFHATVEQIAGGKEIIRVAQRESPKAEESKLHEDIIVSLRQLFKDQDEVEISAWSWKLYRFTLGKLKESEVVAGKAPDWLLKVSAESEERVKEEAGSGGSGGGGSGGEFAEISVEFPDLYESTKVKTDEVFSLLESSLNSKDADANSKWLQLIRYSLEAEILQGEIGEIFMKLKHLSTKKDWQNYLSYLAKIKTIVEKFSDSIAFLGKEAGTAEEGVAGVGGGDGHGDGDGDGDDVKANTVKKFTDKARHRLENLQMVLKHMDHLVTILLANEENPNSANSDDIILVDETKSKKGSEETTTNEKDEL